MSGLLDSAAAAGRASVHLTEFVCGQICPGAEINVCGTRAGPKYGPGSTCIIGSIA